MALVAIALAASNPVMQYDKVRVVRDNDVPAFDWVIGLSIGPC